MPVMRALVEAVPPEMFALSLRFRITESSAVSAGKKKVVLLKISHGFQTAPEFPHRKDVAAVHVQGNACGLAAVHGGCA